MRAGRPKKKPSFDAGKQNETTLKAIKEGFDEFIQSRYCDTDNDSFQLIKEYAYIHDMSFGKMRKILITAGAFENDISRMVGELYRDGKKLEEIQRITGLKRSAVNSYLPYNKGIYKQDETSVDADRIRLFRKRGKICSQLQEVVRQNLEGGVTDFGSDADELLWDAILLYQNFSFMTTRGLKYSYAIKGGEMFVSRKENSKTLTKSTIMLAFYNAVMIQKREGYVKGPKKLGTFGASYLYPVFVRLGVIKTCI